MSEIETAASMRDSFDTIEESYEFMLAYAAQGRRLESSRGGGESQIRQYLKRFLVALDSLEEACSGIEADDASQAYMNNFQRNLTVMRSVIKILLSKASISSDMVDNTNGLVAVRAFLTDIFFIDQAYLPER